MQSLEQVQAEWEALDVQGQMEAWDEFTRDVDYGQAGWNRFYPVLQPLYEAGETPIPLLASGAWIDQGLGLQEPASEADWIWDADEVQSLDDLYGAPPF